MQHVDYQHLVGQRFGPGPELAVSIDRIRRFQEALGHEPDSEQVPLLLIVSLLPALGSGSEMQLPPPRATINYGLDQLEQRAAIYPDDRLRATFAISSIDTIGSALQVARAIEITANDETLVVAAQALSRFVY
ncbi:hypothetical protein BH18ACT5_BH18ACT5_10960 [soil metagenome]